MTAHLGTREGMRAKVRAAPPHPHMRLLFSPAMRRYAIPPTCVQTTLSIYQQNYIPQCLRCYLPVAADLKKNLLRG